MAISEVFSHYINLMMAQNEHLPDGAAVMLVIFSRRLYHLEVATPKRNENSSNCLKSLCFYTSLVEVYSLFIVHWSLRQLKASSLVEWPCLRLPLAISVDPLTVWVHVDKYFLQWMFVVCRPDDAKVKSQHLFLHLLFPSISSSLLHECRFGSLLDSFTLRFSDWIVCTVHPTFKANGFVPSKLATLMGMPYIRSLWPCLGPPENWPFNQAGLISVTTLDL